MNALWLTLALFGSSASIPDGSLLFLENSNQFVELYTRSDTTHVAMVLNEKNVPWVYEATPGEVRKLTFHDYTAELAKMNLRRDRDKKIEARLAAPLNPYSKDQVAAMKALLESQLGRRYSIKGYVRGRSDGIHCAELATRALCAASVLEIARCQDESPATLLAKMRQHSRPEASVALIQPEQRQSWSERRREDWTGFTGWCQWSCWESWTWCW